MVEKVIIVVISLLAGCGEIPFMGSSISCVSCNNKIEIFESPLCRVRALALKSKGQWFGPRQLDKVVYLVEEVIIVVISLLAGCGEIPFVGSSIK